MTIISFVSWWKLLQSSASSSITLTHSRLSLLVSLLSCSGLPGFDVSSLFGLVTGDFLGLLLLPSKIDAIEKSDFISTLPFLICYSTMQYVAPSAKTVGLCFEHFSLYKTTSINVYKLGNEALAVCLTKLLRTRLWIEWPLPALRLIVFAC